MDAAEQPTGNAHRLFTRIAREAGAAILTSTVPIYRDAEGEIPIEFDRTGVLLRICSEHFLLTASHNVEQFLHDETMLYVDVSQRTQLPIPLVNSRFYGTEVDDEFPDRDLVAIHLDQDAVDQFYPQRRFLTLADCDRLIDPRPALYLDAGFPSDTYQMSPVAGGPAMFFFGNIESSPTTANFDSRIHLALSVDGYGLRATETEFVADAIPEFHGMSGCGIWRVAPSTMREPDFWEHAKVRLVAIQNRTQPDSHTIGTWLKCVVDRILDDLPYLKPATEIQYQPGY
jgi:hypothetical protein